jgi:hypothetical protein
MTLASCSSASPTHDTNDHAGEGGSSDAGSGGAGRGSAGELGSGGSAGGVAGQASGGAAGQASGGNPAIQGGQSGAAGATKLDAGAADASSSRGDAGGGAAFVLPPAAMTNLVLWLDAGRGVTATADHVASWKDNSGQGNDAKQDAAAARPELVTTPQGPAVRFSPTAKTFLTIASSPTLNFGTGELTLIVAAGYKNKSNVPKFTGAGVMFFKQATLAGELGLYGNWPRNMVDTGFVFARVGGEGQSDLGTKETTLNDGVLRLYELRRTATSMELRLDGKVSASGNYTPRDVDGTLSVGIGAKPNGTFPLDGDVYAVLAWKGALAPATLSDVENALIATLHITR